jgi:hemoglobin-like flavoprotein
MLDERQRDVIRASFDQVRPIKKSTGELFYKIFFALTPGVAPLFQGMSIMAQGNKLMQMLEYIVDHLDDWASIQADAAELGAKHAGYGVLTDHYAAAGAALVSTLREALGEVFTEEAEDAWMDLYTDVSLAMEHGAVGARACGSSATDSGPPPLESDRP